jgi:Zn-dependent metalloprotease
MKKPALVFAILLIATAAVAAPHLPKPVQATEQWITAESAGQQLGYLAVTTSSRVATNATARAARDQEWQDAARSFAKNRADLLGAIGSEDFVARGIERDELGQTHVRLIETLAGLHVVGADLIVHADSNGVVVGMNGRFLPDVQVLPRAPRVSADRAIAKAISQAGFRDWQAVDAPELTYVLNDNGLPFLAWQQTIRYTSADGEEMDRVYADALTGSMVAREPQIYRAKSRSTYTANNGTTLPGTLKRSEGGAATGDATLDAAHDYAGNVYDYYKNVHGRDSYDNLGAAIKSSVHYSTSYNNAFWNGSQMVYGDGDGTTFIPLSKALDVDAHELTHAVTERTAALRYSSESGALNEATSDILGNSCEAYTKNAGTPNSNTWKVGEDIYTPSTSGDALRYMNNPTQDGSSKDWYPSRYTGTSDNGGVHSNSGIANLAYYLMVMGGTHPRAMSTVNVPALSATSSTSLNMASKIWYRALTVYMTSTTTFSGARTATANAASDLYGGTAGAAYNTVQKAWDAVGAPGGGAPPPPTCTNYSGTLSATGASAIQPNGTYYQTLVTGVQSGKLTGPSGVDFDLYLFKWNGSAWVQVAASEGSTATENISYSGAAGYYYFKVVSYTGAGSYTLCISHP